MKRTESFSRDVVGRDICIETAFVQTVQKTQSLSCLYSIQLYLAFQRTWNFLPAHISPSSSYLLLLLEATKTALPLSASSISVIGSAACAIFWVVCWEHVLGALPFGSSQILMKWSIRFICYQLPREMSRTIA